MALWNVTVRQRGLCAPVLTSAECGRIGDLPVPARYMDEDEMSRYLSAVTETFEIVIVVAFLVMLGGVAGYIHGRNSGLRDNWYAEHNDRGFVGCRAGFFEVRNIDFNPPICLLHRCLFLLRYP